MNRHSIETYMGAMAKEKARMIPRSFREGFVSGFSAPFAFFVPTSENPARYQSTVGEAFIGVGETLKKAMHDEETIIVKKLGKKPRGVAGKRRGKIAQR